MLGVGETILFLGSTLVYSRSGRKIFLLHDECISYYPNLGSDPHSSCLLTHWSPPPEGILKLNIDGSFLENFGSLGAGSVVRNHNGDWITGFSHYEDGGDALLAELRVIQTGLDFCRKKTMLTLYVRVIVWKQLT